MPDHPRDAHAGVGRRAGAVVVAALPGRVAHDRLPRDRVPGHALRLQGVGAGDRHDRVDLVGEHDRPLEAPASRRASRRRPPPAARSRAHRRNARSVRTMSATVITGKSGPYGSPGRRVERRRSGRPAAAAEQVGGDDEVAVGVERLAGADHPVPPAEPLAGCAVAVLGAEPVAGALRRAASSAKPAAWASPLSAWQTRIDVVALRRERAVGLVGDANGVQLPPAVERHRRRQVEVAASRRCRPSRPRASRLARS